MKVLEGKADFAELEDSRLIGILREAIIA